MNKKILITGGCGFIGSHFIDLLLNKKFKLYNIDPLSFVSNKNYSKNKKNYKFYKSSTLDSKLLKKILDEENPTTIINFGAETHVDRSIINPKKFYKYNTEATLNLAIEFKNYIYRNNIRNYKFIHVSTDEVYGSTSNKTFKENEILKPNSPYSASKSSADLLLRSFNKTFNFKSIIIRPSNNFGPRQFPEKLIPKSIRNLNRGKKINIYGNGKNKREWLYVKDCVKTILNIVNSKTNEGIFNIGSKNLISNIDLIAVICEIYFNKKFTKKEILNNFVNFVKDRPGHDFMYKLSLEKIKKNKLLVNSNFRINLKNTVDHFKNTL